MRKYAPCGLNFALWYMMMHMLANAIAVCSSVFSLDLTSSFTAVRANDYY